MNQVHNDPLKWINIPVLRICKNLLDKHTIIQFILVKKIENSCHVSQIKKVLAKVALFSSLLVQNKA